MPPSLTAKERNLLIAVCSEIKGDTVKVNWNNVAGRVNIKYGFHAKANFKNLADKKLANGATTLTLKETALVIAAFQEMSDASSINFNNVAQRTNIKHGYHAKAAFKNLVEKKLGGGSGAQPAGGNGVVTEKADLDGDSDGDMISAPVTPSKKRSPKKGVGKRVSPIKASSGGPKVSTKKFKEEDSPELSDELSTDGEAEMEYIPHLSRPSVYQEHYADEMQDTTSAQILTEERAEATMIGISVEEYRMISADRLHREHDRDSTTGYNDSDDVF